MSGEAITVMSALVFCYALTARRLTFVNVTAPMLSILAGLIVFSTRCLLYTSPSPRDRG